MRKYDLIQEVMLADDSITKVQALNAVESVFDSMFRSLNYGQSVYYRGFGTFKVVTRKAKKARDIGRGITIDIPARKKPVFKPSSKLTNATNEDS